MDEQTTEQPTKHVDIDPTGLPSNERLAFVTKVLDLLSAGELRILRDRAEEKWQEKVEPAKSAVIAKMRAELQELGVDPAEVSVSFGRLRPEKGSLPPRQKRGPAKPKYQGPNGKIWTGRGYAPKWLTDLEAQGHNREEFRVGDETPPQA